jgi:hypothetical protein
MELRIKHKGSLSSPTEIFVRGYTVPLEKSGGGSELQLWDGGKKLGGLLYSVRGSTLSLDHLYAEDMVDAEGEPRPFRSGRGSERSPARGSERSPARGSVRAPVGSILMGAIKAIAKENGIDTIKTLPLPNSRNFYRKMGFNNRGTYRRKNRSRSRNRTRHS